MTRFSTTVLLALQVSLFGAFSVGCGSDKNRDPRGAGAFGGSAGSAGGSQNQPMGNAGVGGLTGTAGTSGGTNGGGATGGTMGQPPPGAARVQFVLKEVH